MFGALISHVSSGDQKWQTYTLTRWLMRSRSWFSACAAAAAAAAAAAKKYPTRPPNAKLLISAKASKADVKNNGERINGE